MHGHRTTTGPDVRLLVSNPAASHVTTGSADWIVVGSRPDRVTGSVDDATSFGRLVEEVQSLPGEYTLVHVDTDHDTTVRAYRGITSSYDLYYCRRPRDGAMVVGDHFRDVLAELDVSSRTVPPSVRVDQLLLGTRPTESYVEGVELLGHGERLEWTRGDEPRTELVETLQADETIGVGEAKRRIDRYFRELLGGDGFDGSVATMLSGGVDSTLLHTYLDADATVSAAFDSPEFEHEVEYARTASDLLGSDHELLMFEEGEYLERLEATIDATGHPLLLPQGTLMHLTFSGSSYRTYLNGGFADGIFGTGAAALAYLARYVGPVVRRAPDVSRGVRMLSETADAIQLPATHPDGSAMNFRIHSHPDRLATYFGPGAVEERKRNRLRYTRERTDVDDGTGYAPHMHLGHAIEYFHDNIATLWRHGAHAHGKSMRTPYCGRAVVETALAVPPSDRYARFALPPRDDPLRFVQYKYIPKDMLAERLPEYDTKKPKGHGLLPTSRYLDDGPLSDAFDRYGVPDIVPEGLREAIRTGTDNLSWYAVNYAVWRDRILENDDLERFGTTAVVDR